MHLTLYKRLNFVDTQYARLSLLEPTSALKQLATGPEAFLKWQTLRVSRNPYRNTAGYNQFVLQALEKFKIFGAVPLGRDIDDDELASKVKLTQNQARRILRHATM